MTDTLARDEVVVPTAPPAGTGIGRGQYLALAAALLGWMFDGAEMGIFPMVARPALKDLLPSGQHHNIEFWFGVVTAGFLVGAATGGVLFGWLGDRIGRVRAMTLSVLTYAVFTGLCGFAEHAWQVGVLRFVAALGMGGEWSLGVALVMELWPNRSRPFMAGLIGAAANVGYLLVGFVGLGLAALLADVGPWLLTLGLPPQRVDALVANQGWRLMMMLGAAPALLTFFIRLFVPESNRWQHERDTGATSHWQTRDLLGILVGAAGPGLIIYLWAADENPLFEHTWPIRLAGAAIGLVIATYGYTYPVRRYLARQAVALNTAPASGLMKRLLLGAALSGVALLGTWGSVQWAPSWAAKLTENAVGLRAKEYTQICAAAGAIIGTIGAALLGERLGRRVTYSMLCIVSMASMLLFYRGNTEYGWFFLATCFLMGLCTASFYGWLPLYLPELFPTMVRATGQGFSFNFGRVLAAVGTLQAGNLSAQYFTIGGKTFEGGYPFACSAMSLIYLVGLVLIWFAPETRGRPLPE